MVHAGRVRSRGHLQSLSRLGQADAELVRLVARVPELVHQRLAGEALLRGRDVAVGGIVDVCSLARRSSTILLLWWCVAATDAIAARWVRWIA